MKTFLSTTYFGPIQWYQKLACGQEVLIERCEHFQKQTYRNRCTIATTQGTQQLTVPVERGTSPLITDTRISDHGNWRHLHWQALQSAYGDSPFFDYYQDDIRPFFERRWTFLFDFNEAIRQTVCDLIDIQPHLDFTTDFVAAPPAAVADFREAIRPKHPLPDPDFLSRPYYQVYRQKHGFLPNLSILDLLFNMGPESVFFLATVSRPHPAPAIADSGVANYEK